LGERFNGIEEVVGSIPSGSTKKINNLSDDPNPTADVIGHVSYILATLVATDASPDLCVTIDHITP
jgi:hypothetical protein